MDTINFGTLSLGFIHFWRRQTTTNPFNILMKTDNYSLASVLTLHSFRARSVCPLPSPTSFNWLDPLATAAILASPPVSSLYRPFKARPASTI